MTIKVGVVLNPALSPDIPVSELGSNVIVMLSTSGASRSTLTARFGAEAIVDAFPAIS